MALAALDDEPIEGVYVRICHVIVQERLRRGWTQLELANMVGMSRASITNIESCRQRLMLHTIQSFGDVFGMTMTEMMDLPEVNPGARIASLKQRLAAITSDRDRLSKVVNGVRAALNEAEGE